MFDYNITSFLFKHSISTVVGDDLLHRLTAYTDVTTNVRHANAASYHLRDDSLCLQVDSLKTCSGDGGGGGGDDDRSS